MNHATLTTSALAARRDFLRRYLAAQTNARRVSPTRRTWRELHAINLELAARGASPERSR